LLRHRVTAGNMVAANLAMALCILFLRPAVQPGSSEDVPPRGEPASRHAVAGGGVDITSSARPRRNS
jgi:hypothetical protein